MPANTLPVWPTPDSQIANVTEGGGTANVSRAGTTAYTHFHSAGSSPAFLVGDGVNTAPTAFLVWTSGANGSLLGSIRVTLASTVSSSAAVMRVWLNNGSAVTTSANTSIFAEYNVPAMTFSTTLATPWQDFPINKPIKANYRVYVTFGAVIGTTTNGGYHLTGFGGQY